MPESQRVTITLSAALVDAVDSRGGQQNRSGAISRDLWRLYTLYEYALTSVPLAVEEALLFVDALNGVALDAASATLLWAEIADAIRLSHLDEKWGVDGPAFVQRLKELDRLQCLALVDAAERFWANPSLEPAQEMVKRYFHIV